MPACYAVCAPGIQSLSNFCCKLCPGNAAGVLRNLLRLRAAGSVPCPPPPGPGSPAAEVADRLAVAASHPTWMVERWLQRFPAEAVIALLAHNNKWVCPMAEPVLDQSPLPGRLCRQLQPKAPQSPTPS